MGEREGRPGESVEDSVEERGGLTVEERRGRPGESVELRELLLVFLPILAHKLYKYRNFINFLSRT